MVTKKQFILLALIILALNLIWEFSHYRLYFDLTGIPSTLHLILASFVDVILIFCMLGLVSLKNKNLTWINNPSKKDYFLTILFNLSLAFVWELMNVGLGRWAYKEIMPTIFGVGLSPMLQLPVIAGMSLLIFKLANKKLFF